MSKLYLIDGSGFIFRAYHALPPLTSPDGTPVGAVVGFVNMIIKLRQQIDNETKRAAEANKTLSAAARTSPELRPMEFSEENSGDNNKEPSASEAAPHVSADRHAAGANEVFIAVIFDAGRHTFRNRIYSEYKANRPPAPDDLIPQFPIVREATEALGLPAIELADFEADDVIATYTKQAREQNMEVVVVSSDKDLMQLVDENTTMYDAMKQRSIGIAEVQEKFKVAPDRVRHILALMGDSSDNIPGVPGIGPKTAAELINNYGDLETLLSRASEIKQNKRRETIIENSDMARLSYELVGLKEDAPVPIALETLGTKPLVKETAIEFCQKYGLKAAIGRIENSDSASPAAMPNMAKDSSPAPAINATPIKNDIKKTYTTLRTEEELAQWVARARKKGHVAFDTETTSLDALNAQLVGFSLCIETGEACYIPLAHMTEGTKEEAPQQDDLFAVSEPKATLAPNQIPLTRAIEVIKPLLEDEAVLKIGHNIKYDMLVMASHKINISPIEDTMLISYCLHAGEHGQSMDELAEHYLGIKTILFSEVTGSGKNKKRFDEVEIETASAYAAEDADITLRMWEYFKPQLISAKMLTLYETIERPLIKVLADMETQGIKVDTAKLVDLSKDFEGRMGELEKDIHQLAGANFNIGSPKQLGEILFEKMQLEGGKKSKKTGAYSTDSETLETLADGGHKIAQKMIAWRQLSKLKSTYTDALAKQINPKTERVHTNFAQAITSTGRLSSRDPNLQNIPIRSDEGKKIREAFIAETGHSLLSADYSQIELRLLAHMADIDVLKAAFKNGEDIHAVTASQMFGVSLNEVDSDLRRNAKMINFGIIYGISAHGLATRLGISRGEAANYIEYYFTQYPGIRDYMESSKEFARKHGYVQTLFGRRCHLPDINNKNGNRRQFSERAAINAPLQGTAADIIKKAMVNVDRVISPAQGDIKMLLQVHDELVFEVKTSEIEKFSPIIKRAMEQAVRLSIPLTVEIGSGSHWGEAH